MRWVGASAAQQAAIAALAPRMGLTGDGDALRPLPVVGRVLQAVSGLPAYVRKTASLPDAATAVREALVQATEPAALLFRDLPAALGLEPFGEGEATAAVRRRADAFADAVAEALRDLTTAYDALLADVDGEVRAAFDLRGRTPDERRDELATRARALSDAAVDPTLRAFVVRASDDLAGTRAWTESLAALLARTPPAQWGDADRARFASALADVARLFRHREAVSFSPDAERTPRARTVRKFRLSVTATHEQERQTVVEVHAEGAGTVHDVALRGAALLEAEGVSAEAQIAALSQLSLALLEQRAGGAGKLDEILASLRPPVASDHA